MTDSETILDNAGEGSRKPPLFLVDGSNVAHGGNRIPRIRYLRAVLDSLARYPVRIVTMVDASLRHKIDNPEDLEDLINSGRVIQAPAGRTVDEFLMQLAIRKKSEGENVYVLTNDRFPEDHARGHIARIAFLRVALEGDEVWLFSPVLESVIPGEVQVA